MSQLESLTSPGGDRRLEELCRLFGQALAAGSPPPRLEDYLDSTRGSGQSSGQTLLLERLLALELYWRRQQGQLPVVTEYLGRFPGHAHAIERVFRQHLFEIAEQEEPTAQTSLDDLPEPPLRAFRRVEPPSSATTALGA